MTIKHISRLLIVFQIIFLFVINIQAKIQSLKIENGRYVSYEAHLNHSDKPVFIFLPGIFRGWTAEDEFIKLLRKEKMNFIAIHYSLHPESVSKIGQQEIAYVSNHNYTAQDLAFEVEYVINKLKIKMPLIVSLSYSSLVSSVLAETKKYSPIVETAPMIRFDESNPSGGQVTDFWESFFNLNPFTGPVITKWYLKQTYQQYWSDVVDSMLKSKNLSLNHRELMIKSYTELSMTAHGFDFSRQNFANGIQRFFILGHREDEHRYKLQQSAIAQYEKKSGYNKSTAVLAEAGHTVPVDAPLEYVELLKKLITE
ncbi:MAG: hypothetical protein ACK4VO_13240 [Pseudobdellovibrio sp.]